MQNNGLLLILIMCIYIDWTFFLRFHGVMAIWNADFTTFKFYMVRSRPQAHDNCLKLISIYDKHSHLRVWFASPILQSKYFMKHTLNVFIIIYSYRTIDISHTNPIRFVITDSPLWMIIGCREKHCLIEFHFWHIPNAAFRKKKN